MGRSFAALLGAILSAATPAAAAAQLVPGGALALELRGGAAVPLGDLAESAPGVGAEAGPHLSVAASWRLSRALSAQAGYSRSWFACGRCGDVGIDDRVVDTGFDAGLEARLPGRVGAVTPWVSAGGVLHQLVFSDEESSLSSDYAVGFRLAAGAAVPLARSLSLKPGVSYRAYSADLALGGAGGQTVDVAHLTVDVGVVYHF